MCAAKVSGSGGLIPLILAASPRAGNSLLAARTFAQAYAKITGGPPIPALELSGLPVIPCTDCGVCSDKKAVFPASPGDLCPLSGRDASAGLFEKLLTAPFTVIAAPIYFYHLPAALKALLDRCQLFWQAARQGKLNSRYGRNAYLILLGAREQGGKLFEGSLLTLRYALEPFGLKLAPPLLLYGLEARDDLQNSPAGLERIRAYAAMAAGLEAPGSAAGKTEEEN